MKSKVFQLSKRSDFERAGAWDLIALKSTDGMSLFFPKITLEVVVTALVSGEFIHLSGPTATGKTSLIETLYLVPETWLALCEARGFEAKPLKVFGIEMAIFDAPGELYFRRALKDGTTYDEASVLVVALLEAAKWKADAYPVMWLREMGRVHSASVQGGLLNLLSRTEISLPDGKVIDGRQIAWIADSNYQAESDSTHTLVPFDDALKRRFSVNLTMDYLSPEQETQALRYLMKAWQIKSDNALIDSVVKLGQAIRRQRAEGALQSVVPPSIYGYLALLRMKNALPDLTTQQLAAATLLGHASAEDTKLAGTVLNQVFGYQRGKDDDDKGNLI